jgi:hypothetical protein
MGSCPCHRSRPFRLPAARRFLPRGRRVHQLAVLGQLAGRGEATDEVPGQVSGKYRRDVPVSEALILR